MCTTKASPGPQRQLDVPVVGFNLAEEDEGKGFGSAAVDRTLERVAQLGVNTVALVVVTRLKSLQSDAFYTYAAPSREALQRTVGKARALGMRVVIVPHIWIDGGQWRGDIKRQGSAAEHFFAAYAKVLLPLAEHAEAAQADALSLGVELKGLTADTSHLPIFSSLIKELRSRFQGVITYSANWDEASQVPFWSELDLVSINGFYPLAERARPSQRELNLGAQRMLAKLDALSVATGKPVLLIEVGYKACSDNAREPWTWPGWEPPLAVDEAAQARAYRAVIDAVKETPRVIGALFWLLPTGMDQPNGRVFEPPWGFSPLGRPAEDLIRRYSIWAQQKGKVGRRVTPPGRDAPRFRP